MLFEEVLDERKILKKCTVIFFYSTHSLFESQLYNLRRTQTYQMLIPY